MVKIDPLKAYDRIDWGFLENVLKAAGFEEYLIRLIMFCMSSTKLAVICNGKYRTIFNLVGGYDKGLRSPLICLFYAWKS